jgi:hypothetical protein
MQAFIFELFQNTSHVEIYGGNCGKITPEAFAVAQVIDQTSG